MDQPSRLTSNDIPHEIWSLIFECYKVTVYETEYPNVKILSQLRLVCRTWNDILIPTFYHHILIRPCQNLNGLYREEMRVLQHPEHARTLTLWGPVNPDLDNAQVELWRDAGKLCNQIRRLQVIDIVINASPEDTRLIASSIASPVIESLSFRLSRYYWQLQPNEDTLVTFFSGLSTAITSRLVELLLDVRYYGMRALPCMLPSLQSLTILSMKNVDSFLRTSFGQVDCRLPALQSLRLHRVDHFYMEQLSVAVETTGISRNLRSLYIRFPKSKDLGNHCTDPRPVLDVCTQLVEFYYFVPCPKDIKIAFPPRLRTLGFLVLFPPPSPALTSLAPITRFVDRLHEHDSQQVPAQLKRLMVEWYALAERPITSDNYLQGVALRDTCSSAGIEVQIW